jgi:hypothetical protein
VQWGTSKAAKKKKGKVALSKEVLSSGDDESSDGGKDDDDDDLQVSQSHTSSSSHQNLQPRVCLERLICLTQFEVNVSFKIGLKCCVLVTAVVQDFLVGGWLFYLFTRAY